ncbi:MAG: CRISPR-associated endonuclease Cas2 [Bacteroidia bacterium]|nr:CRISPR-associated endonuclease Cas2 [Bacteroidia bacterium]MDW8158530.1 CRISPR-associated endonuclease Cas2 [Bacteroidia bacterium]
MYVILVYDVGEERVSKMLKLCRRFLNWIQNSVFEGELSEAQLKKLVQEAKKIMVLEHDSLIIFTQPNPNGIQRQIIGVEKRSLDKII